jgi:hypothetical protein
MQLDFTINVAAMVMIGVNLVGLIWFAFSTQATARAAHRRANEAHERIDDFAKRLNASEDKYNERLNMLVAAFSAYRETIAERYISREAMREVEDRLSAAIEKLAATSAAAIDRLGEPLDAVADGRRRHG